MSENSNSPGSWMPSEQKEFQESTRLLPLKNNTGFVRLQCRSSFKMLCT